MVKLVIQTQSLAGRSHELTAERTTIGRIEDNMFQIAEQSISSHHCEVLLRGSDVVIKDLDSTNGTFINNEKITEGVLKPGQTLRLGQVELRLETGTAGAPVPPVKSAPSAAPIGMPTKKSTKAIQSGLKLSDLEGGGERPALDANKAFSKKRNKVGLYFWVFAGVMIFIIVVLLIVVFSQAGKTAH
jgi:pSer/pThr/pTyr-binding forkhead associated (FHA) protein